MAQAAPSANPLPAVGGVGSAETGSIQQNGYKNTNEYFGDVCRVETTTASSTETGFLLTTRFVSEC